MILLGAGVNGTQPSLMLRSRLDAAARYLADYPEVPVIVTGGQGEGEDITEAECMAEWLENAGVDPARIWREEQATSTRGNFAYSYALMRERGLDPSEGVTFVTNSFHICRARRLAGYPTARAVAAELPKGTYYALLELNYFVREAFALANEIFLGVDL